MSPSNPQSDKRPLITVQTPKAKSTFTLHNPKRLTITVLEPELLFEQGERCDYVFQIPACPVEVYVELKGSDLRKAVSQLASTLRLLNSPLMPKKCIVVLWQRAPPNSDTQVQRLKLHFERKYKCKLEWQTRHGNCRL